MNTISARTRLALTAALALGLAPACVMDHGGGWDAQPEGPIVDVDSDSDLVPVGDGDGDGDSTGEGNGSKQPQLPEDDLEPDPAPDVVVEPDPEPTMVASARGNLVWKRYRAVERDLMRALALTKTQLCSELGQFSCVDVVHLAPLGGNEPFELGQYEPVSAPTATTPIALDRVVLSACVARVEEDKSGSAEVFTDLDLNAASLSLAADGAAVDASVTTLYRRLLSRDPTADELVLTRGLAEGVSAETFAKTACYAIGTTVENFFY